MKAEVEFVKLITEFQDWLKKVRLFIVLDTVVVLGLPKVLV